MTNSEQLGIQSSPPGHKGALGKRDSFLPAKTAGFDKKRRQWWLGILSTEARALLFRPEDDENGGCHARKDRLFPKLNKTETQQAE